MFATTSGTTAQPKYIPITETYLKDYTRAFQIHNYHLIKDFPQAASGKFLILSSDDQEGHVPSGQPYGAVSGLLHRRQSPLVKRHFATPYELCRLKSVDAKYYLMLRSALSQNVTAILGCNPSSLLLLGQKLRECGPDLVVDLFDGTVNSKYRPSNELAEAFQPYLKPDRQKALFLEKLIDTQEMLLPKDIWPNLSVLSCWKGGPMSFYLEQLPAVYGKVAVRDFGYMASEGRGSIPISDHGAGGVTAITSHFFEFVYEDDINSSSPEYLIADQLKVGARYYIYFTTAAGLYRYNINDLVEVVGFFEQTPIIAFVRKGAGISSITGEKLTEDQVLKALTEAQRQLDLADIKHFTLEIELDMPPYYVCFVETKEEFSEEKAEKFLQLFDRLLCSYNKEYEDKRLTQRLNVPRLRYLPQGTYTKLHQLRVLQGAPEAQVKIPLLSTAGAFSHRLNNISRVS